MDGVDSIRRDAINGFSVILDLFLRTSVLMMELWC